MDEALDANRRGELGARQRQELRRRADYRESGLLRRLRRSSDPFAIDVGNGRVEAIEGAVSKHSANPPQRSRSRRAEPAAYRIRIADGNGDEREFTATRGVFDAVPASGRVRLYYLPQSHSAINCEALSE
jgi:hypothetical protein